MKQALGLFLVRLAEASSSAARSSAMIVQVSPYVPSRVGYRDPAAGGDSRAQGATLGMRTSQGRD
jgi:hypothetical protein